MPRLLLVTADDFGLSPDVDAATLDAVSRGVVRSVEVMALAPSFEDAARHLRARPDVDVGVHLTLTSEFTARAWGPLTPRSEAPSLYDARGVCPEEVAEVAARARPDEIVRELDAQIRAVKAAGIAPSHVSQHMFVLDEISEDGGVAVDVLTRLYERHRLPARVTHRGGAAALAARGIPVVTRVPTDTHDVPDDERLAYYTRIVRGVPDDDGVTELVVHCAYDTPAMRAFTSFGPRRARDHAIVVGPELRAAIDESGVTLISWRDVVSSRDVT